MAFDGPELPRPPHREATYRSLVDAVRRTRQEWEGIRLTSAAEAIREGIGADLPFLIRALQSLEDTDRGAEGGRRTVGEDPGLTTVREKPFPVRTIETPD